MLARYWERERTSPSTTVQAAAWTPKFRPLAAHQHWKACTMQWHMILRTKRRGEKLATMIIQARAIGNTRCSRKRRECKALRVRSRSETIQHALRRAIRWAI